jgi:hypothetical protein
MMIVTAGKAADLLSERLTGFYLDLPVNLDIPAGVKVMNPYQTHEVADVVQRYFRKYYKDKHGRIPLLGINPGRFGAGITGITFTDPVRLEEVCGISSSFRKIPELSSVFIYDLINAYGGAARFFRKFILSAVCPLGFIMGGRNLNFYDSRELLAGLEGFIAEHLRVYLEIIGNPSTIICLGEGKNHRFLRALNDKLGLVREIIPVPHPRWVMQYRYPVRKDYIGKYLAILAEL